MSQKEQGELKKIEKSPDGRPIQKSREEWSGKFEKMCHPVSSHDSERSATALHDQGLPSADEKFLACEAHAVNPFFETTAEEGGVHSPSLQRMPAPAKRRMTQAQTISPSDQK